MAGGSLINQGLPHTNPEAHEWMMEGGATNCMFHSTFQRSWKHFGLLR